VVINQKSAMLLVIPEKAGLTSFVV